MLIFSLFLKALIISPNLMKVLGVEHELNWRLRFFCEGLVYYYFIIWLSTFLHVSLLPMIHSALILHSNIQSFKYQINLYLEEQTQHHTGGESVISAKKERKLKIAVTIIKNADCSRNYYKTIWSWYNHFLK